MDIQLKTITARCPTTIVNINIINNCFITTCRLYLSLKAVPFLLRMANVCACNLLLFLRMCRWAKRHLLLHADWWSKITYWQYAFNVKEKESSDRRWRFAYRSKKRSVVGRDNEETWITCPQFDTSRLLIFGFFFSTRLCVYANFICLGFIIILTLK